MTHASTATSTTAVAPAQSHHGILDGLRWAASIMNRDQEASVTPDCSVGDHALLYRLPDLTWQLEVDRRARSLVIQAEFLT